MGLLQHSPRRITKPYAAFCETKKSRALKPPPKVANSGGPVPVARSRWPGVGVPVAGPAGWPGPGGPVPVARSRWPGPGGPVPGPGPGGPVPVARSRSCFKGACPRARAKKDLFCPQNNPAKVGSSPPAVSWCVTEPEALRTSREVGQCGLNLVSTHGLTMCNHKFTSLHRAKRDGTVDTQL